MNSSNIPVASKWALLLLLGVWSSACSTETPKEAPSEAVAVSSSALVGVDGNYTVTAVGEVLNNYTTLGANAAAGDTSISVNNRNSLNSTLFGNLAAGDLLM